MASRQAGRSDRNGNARAGAPEGAARGPASGGADEGARGGRVLRILVLEDDVVDRRALRRALAATGIPVDAHEAEGVLAAIDLMTVEPFDCVFLDYNLPDGDGLTFMRGVRAAGIETPVVMLTGQQDERVAEQLALAGAVDYIDKSDLTPARLVESLRLALGSNPPF